MTYKPKQWMVCLLVGLPIVMVGLGLATGRRPRPEISDSYLPLVPVPTPAPAMPMPASPAGVPVPLPRNESMIAVNQPMPQGLWGQCTPVAASPARASLVPLPGNESMIAVNQPMPQGLWGQCTPVAASPAHAPTPPGWSSTMKMLPFQEAHWQGLEVIPLTPSLGRILKVPSDAKGVIVDDVTGPADMEGFLAGDLITSVGQVATATLESFLEAADRVRDRRRTEVRLLRKGKLHSLVLTGIQERLGTANGETAPMIKPGSRSPHGYLGACTNCHHIGTTGQLAVDQGDLLTRAAPPIRAGQAPPHRSRGECTACHTIIQ
jgi:hypothetical protein